MNFVFNQLLKQQLDELKEKGLNWNLRVLQGPSQPRVKIGGKKVIMLCSNNYLGLANHPKLRKAAIAAVKKYGAGAGSVPAIAGTFDLHVKLKETIAKFKETEAAEYFQTGFAANAGIIPAVVGPEGWVIISDELNHGSIIDGVRLTKAERMIYAHKNMEELEKRLQEAQQKNPKGVLVITDGVFSMDGDIAPMKGIVELCEKYGAISYVDDAHGDGVLGKEGRGIVDHFGLHGRVDIEIGTFSKAFGVVGGYVCGSKELCEFSYNKSRTWLLSGSQPPATVAACIAALELLMKDKKIVPQLWKNTKYYKGELQKLGFDTGVSETPITPIMLGDSVLAQKFAKECFDEGVFGVPIVFPMVAKDKARIRTIVTAEHTKKDLDDALRIFERVGKKLKVL